MADGKRVAALALAGALQGFQQGKQREREQGREDRSEAREAERFQFAKQKFEIEMKKLGLELEELQFEKALSEARGTAPEIVAREAEDREASILERAQRLASERALEKQRNASAAASTQSVAESKARIAGEAEPKPDLVSSVRIQEGIVDGLQRQIDSGKLKGDKLLELQKKLLVEEATLRALRQEAIEQKGGGDIVKDVAAQFATPPVEPTEPAPTQAAPSTPIAEEITATGVVGNIAGRGLGGILRSIGPLLQEASKRNTLADIGRRTEEEVERRKIAPPFIRPSGSF